jgi:hypothetical protein
MNAFWQLVFRGAAAAAVGVVCGCTAKKGINWDLPVYENADRIVADAHGAWTVVSKRASVEASGRIPPTHCVARRLRPDGSIELEKQLHDGGCRQLLEDSRGLLVLQVSDTFTMEYFTSLWAFDGHDWRNSGKLPCDAVGVYRLSDGSTVIWSGWRLFRRSAGAESWTLLPLAIPDTPDLASGGVRVLGQLAGGELVVALNVWDGNSSTARIGLYSESTGFKEGFRAAGRVASALVHRDGEVLIAFHTSAHDSPSVALYLWRSARDQSHLIYRGDRFLPTDLQLVNESVILVGQGWTEPKSFLSTFPTRIIELKKHPDGTWRASRDKSLDGWEPRLVAFAPDRSAWCTYSSMRAHGIAFIDATLR